MAYILLHFVFPEIIMRISTFYPTCVSPYNNHALSRLASSGLPQPSNPNDSVVISNIGQQMCSNSISNSNAIAITNETGYPPGFPNEIKQKISDMKQKLGPLDPAITTLEMELIGKPMLESMLSSSGSQGGQPDAEIFSRGNFDMPNHIQRLISDTKSQINSGQYVELNTKLLSLLNQLT